MTTHTTSKKRGVLLVWNWNEGRDKIENGFYDRWGAGEDGVLVRIDRKIDEKSEQEVLNAIESIAAEFDEAIILLHETHRYAPKHTDILMQRRQDRAGKVQVWLFGGARGPLYIKNHDLGILGANANFASDYIRKLPDGGEENRVSSCILSRNPPQINTDHFNHIWETYRYGFRHSVESLMNRYLAHVNSYAEKNMFWEACIAKEEHLYNEMSCLATTENPLPPAPLAARLLLCEETLQKRKKQEETTQEDKEQCEKKLRLLDDLRTAIRSVLNNKNTAHQHDPLVKHFKDLYNALPPYGL
jgi:hypothetical protein